MKGEKDMTKFKKVKAGYYTANAGTYEVIHHRTFSAREQRYIEEWRLYRSSNLLGRYRTMKEAFAGLDEYKNTVLMTKEEKLKIFSDEQILEGFIKMVDNFNPCDFDACDTYEKTKAEILRRMKKEVQR